MSWPTLKQYQKLRASDFWIKTLLWISCEGDRFLLNNWLWSVCTKMRVNKKRRSKMLILRLVYFLVFDTVYVVTYHFPCIKLSAEPLGTVKSSYRLTSCFLFAVLN